MSKNRKIYGSAVNTPIRSHLCLDFQDVDLLGESIPDWNVEFRQLKKGKFKGRVSQITRDGWVVAQARISMATEQVGLSHAGLRTIVITADQNGSLMWRGHRIQGNDLMIFPKNGELHAVGYRNFNILTLSFRTEDLQQIFQNSGAAISDKVLDLNEVLQLSKKDMAPLRQVLKLVSSTSGLTGKDHPLRPDPLRVFAATLERATQVNRPNTLGKGERVLHEAIKILRADIMNQLSVISIAQQLQVSPRTLDSAFLDFFGITPAAYRKAMRLNAVHRQLRRANPASTLVQDVAKAFGFIHMSQFATDYREHFGLLPSESLVQGFE